MDRQEDVIEIGADGGITVRQDRGSRGYRWIEWIGNTGIFTNPVVQYNLAFDLYSPSELRVLRALAKKRLYRTNLRVVRELRPDSPAGLSRFYQWGPEIDSYMQPVPYSDARIIMSDPACRREFLDVTDLEPMGPAGTKRHRALLPVTHANPAGLILPTGLRQAADEQTKALMPES